MKTKKTKRLNLPLAWVASIIVSGAIGSSIYVSGVNGDCKPHEIDGQCGLSSFVGLIDGVLVGTLVLATVAVYLSISTYKRHKTSAQEDSMNL